MATLRAPTAASSRAAPLNTVRSKLEADLTRFCTLYVDLTEGNGLKPMDARECLRLDGYTRSTKTLYRHIKQMKKTGHAILPFRRVSSQPLLNDVQVQELRVWILSQNDIHRPVQRKHVRDWIQGTYGIQADVRTCGKILAKLGMSRKVCQSRTSGFTVPSTQLKTMWKDFRTKMKRENLFVTCPSNICSLDTTVTRKPKDVQTTFSPIGSGKQKATFKTSTYSDALVTMIWADGKNRTPCRLYTHNPKLNLAQKNTDRGRRIRADLEAALEENGISADRIVYSKSNKYYCGESPEMYLDFLNFYDVKNKSPEAVILHDGGKSFKIKKTSIFDANGYARHVEYPSEIHQYLSPNDNSLHGVKSTWKGMYFMDEGDVLAPIKLMRLIDEDSVKNSRYYFERNILCTKTSYMDEVLGLAKSTSLT